VKHVAASNADKASSFEVVRFSICSFGCELLAAETFVENNDLFSRQSEHDKNFHII